MDLPALSPIPAEQAGLAQAGKAEMLCLCQPGLPTHSSGLCTRRCHLQGSGAVPSSGDTAMGRDLRCSHFPALPRGVAQAALSQQSKLQCLGMQHFLTGRRKGKVGLQREGSSDMSGIYDSLTNQSGSVLQNHRMLWVEKHFEVLPLPTPL